MADGPDEHEGRRPQAPAQGPAQCVECGVFQPAQTVAQSAARVVYVGQPGRGDGCRIDVCRRVGPRDERGAGQGRNPEDGVGGRVQVARSLASELLKDWTFSNPRIQQSTHWLLSADGSSCMRSRNLTLGSGGAEAAFPTSVGRCLEELYLAEDCGGRPYEDELSDPGPRLYEEGLLAVVVYEGNLDLPAVARVYETRRVDEGDPMPDGQAAAREHESSITLRYSYRDPCPHQRPVSRRQAHPLDRTQIVARVPQMCSLGCPRLGD